MKKYTFICEFRKGTYISQYLSEDLISALGIWADCLVNPILSDKEKAKLKWKISDEVWAPVPIDGVENVWCSSFSIGRSFLLLNIVETI